MDFKLSLSTGVYITGITIILLCIAIVVLVFINSVSKVKRKYVAAVIAIAIVSIFVYLAVISMQIKVSVYSDQIKLNLPPFLSQTVSKDQILKAYVVDNINNDKNLNPTTHMNGALLGNYRLGEFKLKNGKDAILMTDRPKVLCIETKDGYLLLAPTNFDEFVKEVSKILINVQ